MLATSNIQIITPDKKDNQGVQDSRTANLVKNGKRVEFSQAIMLSPKSIPPFRGSRPVKSILKKSSFPTLDSRMIEPDILTAIYSGSKLSDNCSTDQILQTACIALAQPGQDRQLEIYGALNASLRDPEKPILTQTLCCHADRLIQFARRDLLVAEASSDNLDHRIVIQIVKVVDYLFFTSEVTATLDIDLARWFLIHALESLDSQTASKSVMGAYLHLLNNQRIPRVFTADMASRLISAVHNMPTFSSSAIISECLCTYRHIIQLAPNVMISRLSEWLPRVICGLIDGNSLVRQRALKAALECNKRFPSHRGVGRFVYELLANPADSSESFGSAVPSAPLVETFEQFLVSYIELKGDTNYAMSVWQIIVLLLQSWGITAEEKFIKWPQMTMWLEIHQLALSSDHLEIRVEAIQAWRSIITVWVQPGKAPLPKLLEIVLKPLRKIASAEQESEIQALATLYTSILAVYTKPVQTAALPVQLSLVWNEIVVTFTQQCLRNPLAQVKRIGINFFKYLLGNNTPNLTATIDSLTNAFPAKWIRANSKIVLDLMAKVFIVLPDDGIQLAQELWVSYLVALKSLTQREVQLGAESNEAVTRVCEAVGWISVERPLPYVNIAFLMHTAIDQIGIDAFLSRDRDPISATHSGLFRVWNRLISSPQIVNIDPEGFCQLAFEFINFASTKMSKQRRSLDLFYTALNVLEDAEDLSNDRKMQLWLLLTARIKEYLDKMAENDVVEEDIFAKNLVVLEGFLRRFKENGQERGLRHSMILSQGDVLQHSTGLSQHSISLWKDFVMTVFRGNLPPGYSIYSIIDLQIVPVCQISSGQLT